jgi:regulator of replication initiation timing
LDFKEKVEKLYEENSDLRRQNESVEETLSREKVERDHLKESIHDLHSQLHDLKEEKSSLDEKNKYLVERMDADREESL